MTAADTAQELRDQAVELDRTDPLAPWRSEFVIADPDLVYLDGNSLGMTPKRTVAAVRDVVERQWAGDLITSWWEHGWLDLPTTVGDELAPLLGAGTGEVAVHDSTTICLFQLINVALDLDLDRDTGSERDRPAVIAVADTEFPTDRYVADGIARLRSAAPDHRANEPGRGPGVIVRRGLDDLDGVDVVVRSHVDYRTAEVAPLASETARAAEADATTVWDLSHSAGLLAVDLDGAGVELAAGCTYKFLNGGPGAPGFTYVRRSIQDRVTQPIWGWFAQTDQFAMDDDFDPRPGSVRLLNGTPGILGLAAARAGISVIADAGIAAIASKAAGLARFAIQSAHRLGLPCETPPPPATSGGHVAVLHPDAERLQRSLTQRKVIVDKRDPDRLRLGLSPLTTRYVDVVDALSAIAALTR